MASSHAAPEKAGAGLKFQGITPYPPENKVDDWGLKPEEQVSAVQPSHAAPRMTTPTRARPSQPPPTRCGHASETPLRRGPVPRRPRPDRGTRDPTAPRHVSCRKPRWSSSDVPWKRTASGAAMITVRPCPAHLLGQHLILQQPPPPFLPLPATRSSLRSVADRTMIQLTARPCCGTMWDMRGVSGRGRV